MRDLAIRFHSLVEKLSFMGAILAVIAFTAIPVLVAGQVLSFVINCSRGASINDADLLAALASGQIEAAALDVFRTEPLPQNDPYWHHPNVFVTPHAAAPSNERSAARFIARNIRKAIDGDFPAPIVDLARGY